MVSQKDKQIIRELAKEYMVYANLPIQKTKLQMHKDLNDIKMQRPMVIVEQECWNELNENDCMTILCENEFLRSIEWNIRSRIYKWKNYPVDMVLEPFISFGKAIHNSGFGVSPQEDILATDSSNSVVSHSFKNQFTCMEDVDKIKDMIITHDEAETKKRQGTLEWILEDIAPVKAKGMEFHLGVWDNISLYMGVENIYYALVDQPELLHKIVGRLTDSTIAGIKKANELKVCEASLNQCHCSYTYREGFLQGFQSPDENISQNSWAFGLAQLFTSVSPQITEEFELPYITKMAEYFGNIYYGCCDKLSDRLDIVSRIPNVRKISCSPWSDIDEFALNLPKNLIMSYKPNPAVLATDTFDENAARKDLRKAIDAAKRNNIGLEIILKDISTLKYQPQRLRMWNKIAMEEVEKW